MRFGDFFETTIIPYDFGLVWLVREFENLIRELSN